METAIPKLAVLSFLIIGLSHVLQPRAWAQFFIAMHKLGEPGAFIVAFPSLVLGLVIVTFHNVWSGLPVVLTVIGWGQLLKAALYLLYPRWGVRILSRISVERSRQFVVAGGVLLVLAAVVALPLILQWSA